MVLPHIALPLTAEPSKSRLCHDVRHQNLWIRGNPFSQDTLNDLLRCVMKDPTFQAVWDDKSGYDLSF